METNLCPKKSPNLYTCKNCDYNTYSFKDYKKHLSTAKQKLETARNYLNSNDYLKNNSTYQNLLSARETAEQNFNKARDFYDSEKYYKDNMKETSFLFRKGLRPDIRKWNRILWEIMLMRWI